MVPSGAEARVVYGVDGTAKAVPFHKTICEIASENWLGKAVRGVLTADCSVLTAGGAQLARTFLSLSARGGSFFSRS